MFDFSSLFGSMGKGGAGGQSKPAPTAASKPDTTDGDWKKIYEGMVANYMQNPTPPPPAAQLDMPPQMDAMSHYRPANSVNDMAGLLNVTPKYEQKQKQIAPVQNEQYIRSLLRM
jgi:hypothetical protein